MIEADKRKAIFLLHQEGMSAREMARRLAVGRNTVRTIIEQKGQMPEWVRPPKVHLDPELLQRVQEKLAEVSDQAGEGPPTPTPTHRSAGALGHRDLSLRPTAQAQ